MNELNRENQWAFFKIEGFAGKRSLLSPPPPPTSHRFALAPFFHARPECLLWRPEFSSLRTGTLATQAMFDVVLVFCSVGEPLVYDHSKESYCYKVVSTFESVPCENPH